MKYNKNTISNSLYPFSIPPLHIPGYSAKAGPRRHSANDDVNFAPSLCDGNPESAGQSVCGEGEEEELWAGMAEAINESLAESDDQQERDAIELSRNEEFMRENGLEPVYTEGDGVC
jgi:hypothetical protein